MKRDNHWVEMPDFEELDHGAVLTKFIAKSNQNDTYVNGQALCVEIHGFVTDSGEFLITNKKFERKDLEESRKGE